MTTKTRAASESEECDSIRRELLHVLAQAVELRDGDFRMNSLLADFENGNGFAKGWQMAVGEYFRDSLDIKSLKQTNEAVNEAANDVVGDENVMKWTQGGTFSFSLGDTVYDTPLAYQRWDEALKNIGVAFQVLAAAPSRPRREITYRKKNTSYSGSLAGGRKKANLARRQEVVNAAPPDWVEEKDLIEIVKAASADDHAPGRDLLQELCDVGALDKRVDVEQRFPGVVRFRVLAPNAERSKLCIKEEKVLSQDDFVALLITGNEPKHDADHSPGAHPNLLKH
jgi:hypothetical protein